MKIRKKRKEFLNVISKFNIMQMINSFVTSHYLTSLHLILILLYAVCNAERTVTALHKD